MPNGSGTAEVSLRSSTPCLFGPTTWCVANNPQLVAFSAEVETQVWPHRLLTGAANSLSLLLPIRYPVIHGLKECRSVARNKPLQVRHVLLRDLKSRDAHLEGTLWGALGATQQIALEN